jgi:hypothetical protein
MHRIPIADYASSFQESFFAWDYGTGIEQKKSLNFAFLG